MWKQNKRKKLKKNSLFGRKFIVAGIAVGRGPHPLGPPGYAYA